MIFQTNDLLNPVYTIKDRYARRWNCTKGPGAGRLIKGGGTA